MEFLGSIGIDIKLLIAQIINFGLLLWLLTKFLYKPIIKRIEKDETKLRQAQTQMKELEQEKNSFLEQKEKTRIDTQRQVREVMKEANDIALKIRKEAHEKVENEISAVIKQTKDNLESLQPDIEKEISKKMQIQIKSSFKNSFIEIISPPLQKEFQDVFWTNLIKQIKELTLLELKKANLTEVVKRFKKENGTEENILRRNLEKVFTKKIGPIVLESAHPLTGKQWKELEEIISKKAGVKLDIIKKQNKNLINGFRFEVTGIIIESNLLNIINDASKFKK